MIASTCTIVHHLHDILYFVLQKGRVIEVIEIKRAYQARSQPCQSEGANVTIVPKTLASSPFLITHNSRSIRL